MYSFPVARLFCVAETRTGRHPVREHAAFVTLRAMTNVMALFIGWYCNEQNERLCYQWIN